MSHIPSKPKRAFTESARAAALAARRAKADKPDDFGIPELFIARTGPRSFRWEIRRFGGVLLQRGERSFASFSTAKAAGDEAIAALCASSDLPTFKRQNVD